MADLGPIINSPFSDAVCPTPSGGDSTLGGPRGGDTGTDMPGETPNSSGIGPYTMFVSDLKDAPARGSTVNVEPGVASPAVPTAPMDKQ